MLIAYMCKTTSVLPKKLTQQYLDEITRRNKAQVGKFLTMKTVTNLQQKAGQRLFKTEKIATAWYTQQVVAIWLPSPDIASTQTTRWTIMHCLFRQSPVSLNNTMDKVTRFYDSLMWVILHISPHKNYTVARRWEFYFLVLNTTLLKDTRKSLRISCWLKKNLKVAKI